MGKVAKLVTSWTVDYERETHCDCENITGVSTALYRRNNNRCFTIISTVKLQFFKLFC